MPIRSPLPRRSLLALTPLLAARCAGLPGRACDARPNTIPVAIAQYLPFVAATVSGWPVTALLDTGAERTLVADTLLPGLGLPSDPRRRAYQTGATGPTAPRPIAALPRLGLGSATFRNLPVGVIDRPGMPGPEGTAPQIILGADVLGQHELDLDLPARRVTLYPGSGCAPSPPLPGPVHELPMQLRRDRVITQVVVNGRPADAMLDTGANTFHLSRARAEALGVTEAEIAAAPQRRVRGINNEVQTLALVRIDLLQIGPELLRNVPTLVGETLIADLVIGTPWLGQRRLFISYARQQLLMAAPSGPAV